MAHKLMIINAIVLFKRGLLAILIASILSGCNEKTVDTLYLKESEIQSDFDQQLPINGLVSVQIRIPDEVANLSGFFAERVVSDPIVEAGIELSHAEIALLGPNETNNGRMTLMAEPVIKTKILGIDIAETLSLELSGQLSARDGALYFEPKTLTETGSFFLNNFVPKDYRSQFVDNLNDWFVAYFSAYPLYQAKEGERVSAENLDNTTIEIEDDLVRFH